ncbi:MAG: hypothetical protein Q9224_005067 [Gallowayella concinna]
MVLETSSMSDAYDASLDTPDPYDTNLQITTDNRSYDSSQFPRPLPLFGPLFGFNAAHASNLTDQRIRHHVEEVGRALSPKECEAIAFHTYKSTSVMSYGVTIIAGFGLHRAYKTREGYRFPLSGNMKKPGGWWDGNRIRIMGQTVLKGFNARLLLHTLRSSVYVAGAVAIGRIVVASYATTVATVGEMRDPRLKDYQYALHGRLTRQKGEPEAMNAPVKDPTGQGDTSVSDLWKRHRKDIGGLDDTSPTAGADGYGGDVERLGGSGTGTMSDAQMQAQETRQRASSKNSPTGNRATTARRDKVEKQPRNFGDVFDDDDASPTARGNANEGQGASSWERIRRQAQTGSSGGKSRGQSWDTIKREQKNGSTTGDSFAFSSDDEQRQLAKDEAQNEFDARVEKERQGGNFNENRGRRW